MWICRKGAGKRGMRYDPVSGINTLRPFYEGYSDGKYYILAEASFGEKPTYSCTAQLWSIATPFGN